MSLLVRAKLEAAAREDIDELYRKHGCIPENYQNAISLRMQFFTRYILDQRPSDYKSPIEKDWAYVARREYRYDVNVRALCDAYAVAHLTCMMRMFMLKKFVIWPFIPVFALTYAYRARSLFILHNKKFFDMCNVGE